MANSNQSCSYFPHNFGAHMNILFIIKLKIPFLIKWSYKCPELCWLSRLEWLLYFQHVVQSFLTHDAFLISVLWATPNHTPLKYRCLLKMSNRIKVDNSCSILFLYGHLYLSGMCYGSKNKYQKGIVFVKEIGPHAQNVITILGSIVNIIGEDLYDHLMSTRITLLMNIMIRRDLNFMRKVTTAWIWTCWPSSNNRMSPSLGEVG